MKRNLFLKIFLVILATNISFGGFFLCTVSAETITLSQDDLIVENSISYTEEDLFDLMSPSAVIILQHIEGSVVIPSFIIDSEDKTIAIDSAKEPTIIDNISENILGSGFFVSPNGLIITNAHTVSLAASKLVIIDSFIQKAIFEASEGEDVNEMIDELFTEEIVDFMLKETTFDLKKDVVVLSSEKDVTEEENFSLYDLGSLADVLSVNDVFYKQGYDIALLKIEGEEYPSAMLSPEESISLGEKLFLLQSFLTSEVEDIRNFTAKDSNNLLLVESILTREKVSTGSSTIYELNIPVATSLGGSIVFDSFGEVRGMAVYDASDGLGEDSSMLVISNTAIKELLFTSSTTASASTFYTWVKKGLLSEKELLCDEAHASYTVALGASNNFVDEDVFVHRITSCNEEVSILNEEKNKSVGIFGVLHTFQEKIASMSIFHWVIVVAVLFISFLIILWLFSRKKHHENIQELVSEIPIRDETIKTARRQPLSERIPVLHSADIKTTKTGIIPPQQGKVSDDIKVKESDVSKESHKKEKKKVSLEVENIKDDHIVTANFPRETNLPGDVDAGSFKKTNNISNNISESDKKRLASLWPNKYNEEKIEEKDNPVFTEIILYIKNTRKLGFTDDEIKKELLRVGWKDLDIQEIFKTKSLHFV